MATTDFLPTRESELVTWSINFSTRITANPTSYGLTAAQATAYDTLHDAFITAYNAATNDGTNSRAAIVTKNTAKVALIANARLLAGIVQRDPDTTNTQRSELGLTVRDLEPSPIPPPASAPGILVISAVGATVRIRLIDPANPTRRGKPPGVDGATVLSFVGANAPADLGDWKLEGNTTRTSLDIAFDPDSAPGTKVWITAFWFNPRKQSGPASAPISANLPGGAAMAA